MDGQVNLQTGIKHDGGKVRMDLLSPFALEEIARVMTVGATKYGDNNWRGGLLWSRVFSALMRHAWAYWRGENFDPETGLNHLAHCGCCIMFLLEYSKSHPELDDRYGASNETNAKHRANLPY